MRKRLSAIQKPGYMLLSMLLAIILWFIIMGVVDPVMTRTVRDVRITVRGASEIYNKYELRIVNSLDNLTADVQLEGNRNTILRVKKSDITLIIDVSAFTASTYDYPVQCTYEGIDASVTVTNLSSLKVNISVDQYTNMDVEVRTQRSGDPAEGYVIGDITASSGTVRITGPQTELKTVAYALVDVKIKGESQSFEATLPMALKKQDGSDVTSSYVNIVPQQLSVTVPVLEKRELPLSIDIMPGGGITDSDVTKEITPKTITIAAEPKLLAELDEIMLGSIFLEDIDKEQFVMSKNLQVAAALPAGVKNVEELAEVTVKVTTNDVKTTNFVLKPTMVTWLNKPTNRTVSILDTDIIVTLRGNNRLLSTIDKDDIKLSIDLRGINTNRGDILSLPLIVSVGDGKLNVALMNTQATVRVEFK